MSSEDEEHEAPAAPRPPARASSRRQPKVDFTKLEITSLQKYRKAYKLGDAPASTSKEDLIPPIQRHFASQAIEEDEVLINFALALKKHTMQSKTGGVSKKPRNGPKPKPR